MVLLLPKAFQAFAAMSVDCFPDEKRPPKVGKAQSALDSSIVSCTLKLSISVLLLASQCE